MDSNGSTRDVTLADGTVIHGVPAGIPDASVQAQYAAHLSVLVNQGKVILGDRTLPDGTVIHGVPSNLTDAQVLQKVHESKQARAAASKPQPAMQSWGRTLADIPVKTVAGIGDMFVNAPVNLINLGIAGYGTAKGLLGGKNLPEPIPVPDVLQHIAGYSGLTSTAPQTPAQAGVQRYGEAALAAIGGAPERSIADLTRAVGTGLAAQAGSDVAGAAVPERFPAIKEAASVVGGLALPGGISTAGRKVAAIPLGPSARVGKLLDATLTPETAGQVLNYKPGSMEPFTPSLSQVAPSAETAEVERWARRQPGSTLFNQLDQQNQDAMQAVLDKAVQGREDALTVAEHVSGILSRDTAAREKGQAFHDEAVQQAQQAVQQAQDSLDSRMIPTGKGAETLGAQVQGDVHRAQMAADAERDRTTAPLRDAAYASEVPVDLNPIMDKLDEAIKDAGMNSVVGKSLQTLRAHIEQHTDIGSGEYYTDVKQADTLRADIKNRMAGRSEDASQQYAKKQLNGVLSDLNEAMDTASGGKWSTYLKAYASESKRLLGPFEHQHVSPLIERDTYNQNFTGTPAQVAAKVFRPGPEGAEVIRNLTKAGAATPAARQALQAHVADQIERFRSKGQLNLSQLHGFLRDYGPALKASGMYKQLDTDAKAIQFARDHEIDVRKEEQQYTQIAARQANKADLSDLGRLVKADQPQRIIQGMLDKPDGTQRIARLADTVRSDPGAFNGLRRSVMDALVPLSKPGGENSMADALRRFDAKKGALKSMGLYDDKQLADMRSVLEQLQRESLAKAGGRRSPGFSEQANNMLHVMGSAIADRASKVALAGVVSASHLLGAAGGALISYAAEEQLSGVFQNRAKAKLAEAAYDPKVAQMLLRTRTTRREAASGALVKVLSQQVAQQAAIQGVNATRKQQ